MMTNYLLRPRDQNLSHVTTGYIRNSPSRNWVRVDEAYAGGLASSLFNYTNVTVDGLVDNTPTTFDAKGGGTTTG